MKLEDLLFLLILISSAYIFMLFAYELKNERKEFDLIVKSSLENREQVNFKLTFNQNRPMIRENNDLFPYLCCESFLTEKMNLFRGKYCFNGQLRANIFSSSLTFRPDIHFEDIQLVATHDRWTSQRGRYSGLLGIDPIDHCNSSRLDPNAIINRMRKENDGFKIDIPRLIFTSDLTGKFEAPLDGKFFEILNFRVGSANFLASTRLKLI
jgi:hypothetical protein